MAFPFSASFERSIKTVVTPENKDQLLSYIKETILEDKADNVVFKDMTVSYEGSTSHWNIALFRSVDNGTFSLVCSDDKWFLTYQIGTRSLVIWAPVVSCVVEVFSLLGGGPWWAGIAVLCWPFGISWLSELMRHGSLASDIAAGIDHLTGAEPEEPEEDKMNGKLKSWF